VTERRPPAKRAPAKRAPRKVTPPEPEPPVKRRSITIRLPSGFSTLRDVIAFLAGMAIIVNEVFLSKKVDPSAVAVGVSLTGLPLVFGADERRKSGEKH
jgi:hypothetical protein